MSSFIHGLFKGTSTDFELLKPFAEAMSSMLCELPTQLGTTIVFDLTLYFMTNLRRTPGAFFTFFLFTLVCTLTMSMVFRSIAALSRTFSAAMAPAAIVILAFIIYTGFAIPTRYMHPWFRWLNWLNPVGYAFESLMINQFSGSKIACSNFVPTGDFSSIPGGINYNAVSPFQRICSTTGAEAGADFVDGDTWLGVNYQYYSSHLWRNLGIIIALMLFGLAVYLIATEYISAKKSKGEVLLFRRGGVPKQ